MNCKQIQSSFYDYADGTVGHAARSAIDSHLSGCAACRRHYERQRRLHQSVTSAVADGLAGLHFQPGPIAGESSGADRRFWLGVWGRSMAFATPCLLLLCAALWLLLRPAPRPTDDPARAAYAEAYQCLEMYGDGKPGVSSLTMPVAVIVQPGAPARVFALDGTTDISAKLK